MTTPMSQKAAHRAALVALVAIAAAPAVAASPAASCPEGVFDGKPSSIHFRYENDHYAGQDQGYSSGLRWQAGSRDLSGDSCRTALRRVGDALFGWALPSDPEALHLVAGVEHHVYTPSDRLRTDLVVADRPYAGWFFSTWGMRAERGRRRVEAAVDIGVVGPWAQGEAAQNLLHRILGRPEFSGWDNQLGNELGITARYRDARRVVLAEGRTLGLDVIPHWGGSLGNVATHAEAGAELRLGWRLPDDFGRWPSSRRGERSAYLFVAGDGRYVVRDLFLDGNTFRDSHSVERRPWVGEASVGVAAHFGSMRVSFSMQQRSREFDGQAVLPRYGSLAFTQTF